uniref:Uncharacterized protein n=1 Tax=Peronospora matthiolae TaxID=2874970 RepID=A0AAV1UME6_9STRA
MEMPKMLLSPSSFKMNLGRQEGEKVALLHQQGSQQAELLREQGAQQFELLRQQQAAAGGSMHSRRPETPED